MKCSPPTPADTGMPPPPAPPPPPPPGGRASTSTPCETASPPTGTSTPPKSRRHYHTRWSRTPLSVTARCTRSSRLFHTKVENLMPPPQTPAATITRGGHAHRGALPLAAREAHDCFRLRSKT